MGQKNEVVAASIYKSLQSSGPLEAFVFILRGRGRRTAGLYFLILFLLLLSAPSTPVAILSHIDPES